MNLSPPLQQVDRTHVLFQNRKLTYFAGCDYFRMASHPKILKAVADGLSRFGLGVAASRRTTGNHKLYEQLERELARFFGVESATLASSGYAPNIIAAQALAGRFSHALIDERAHGSLVDATRFLDCPVLKFKHRDAGDLERVLARIRRGKLLVMTDGVFSHDGGIAPIKDYLKALPPGGMLLLDDAHGAGVLGRSGKGTVEHAAVSTKRIIQTVTLSKAFGVYGGAVLGTASLRSVIIERSRMFIGNTPLPLPLANAAIQSVHILKKDRRMRDRLARNVSRVKAAFRARGLPTSDDASPIISIQPKSASEANRLCRRLLAAGIHPPLVHYPGGPPGGHFRFAISSEHSKSQLVALVEALG